MKRVVVTGGTGFVGSNLVRRLLSQGYKVHLLVRKDYQAWRVKEIIKDIHLHPVDIADASKLARVLANIRPDWIFHLATFGAYPWQDDLSKMLQTNVVGTANLVNAALKTGFEIFINTGSSSEYGFKDHAASETEFLEPNSQYAVAKASATLFCGYTARKHNVHIPTLRLYSVYGPYEEPERLIPSLILEGFKGKFPPLVNPDISRDFVYVEDVAEVYLRLAIDPGCEYGAIYNVGTGIKTSIKEAVEIARNLLKINAKPALGSMRKREWDSSIWLADNRKMKEKLSWQPRYSFKDGFRKTVEWFKENPELLEFYQKHVLSFKKKMKQSNK